MNLKPLFGNYVENQNDFNRLIINLLIKGMNIVENFIFFWNNQKLNFTIVNQQSVENDEHDNHINKNKW
jgi:hypothetical protein